MKYSSSARIALLVAAVAGCKKQAPEPPAAAGAVAITEATATPLPAGAGDGMIGVAGPARLVAAAADGSWVAVCAGQPEKVRIVVGDGGGLVADRIVAGSERDLVVVDGDALVHVDLVARTARTLGRRAPAAVDADSRRVVQVDDTKVIVRDPGTAPRTIDVGVQIGAVWGHGKRWLEVGPGEPPRELATGYCGWVGLGSYSYANDQRRTIDLDPSGIEALDRVGPELGVTGGGEITLDGAVVASADCVGLVVAALATPPRALVMCTDDHNHVVGPGGWDHPVGGSFGQQRSQAGIASQLTLGVRVFCVTGACIDLISGREFGTWSNELVWRADKFLVRKGGGNLLIDDLDQERQRTVVLPRITQAVTIDTATGRRTSGPAPSPPAYIDGTGRFLLYGRHVIDVEGGALIATLADDAIAIDERGRVLLPASPGQGPLHWRAP